MAPAPAPGKMVWLLVAPAPARPIFSAMLKSNLDIITVVNRHVYDKGIFYFLIECLCCTLLNLCF